MLSLPTSPRVLTPTASSTFELLDNDVEHTTDEIDSNVDGADFWHEPIELEANASPQFDSAEQTLRELLVESNRIKEMVSEAELRARSWLQTKTTPLEELADGTAHNESSEIEEASASDGNTEEAVSDNRNGENIRFRQRPVSNLKLVPSDEPTEDIGNQQQQHQPAMLACPSPLRTVPSYDDLYNEELIENNKLCYMQ